MNNPMTYVDNLFMNQFGRTRPFEVHGQSGLSVDYYKRILYNKIYSLFDFQLPNDWELNWFRFNLFHLGSIAVVYSDDYGWICSPYGITDINWQYQPKSIIVENAFIPTTIKGEIGVDSEIIKCFDDYRGFEDIVTRYATKFASIDKSVDINLTNCNTAVIHEAENSKEATTINEAYKQVSEGKPLVIVNKNKLNEFKPMFANVRNTFITNDLLIAKRTIMNEFLTTIGINNTNYDKKERLTTSEVTANDGDVDSIYNVVYKNLLKGCENLAKIGVTMSVTKNYENTAPIESEVDN